MSSEKGCHRVQSTYHYRLVYSSSPLWLCHILRLGIKSGYPGGSPSRYSSSRRRSKSSIQAILYNQRQQQSVPVGNEKRKGANTYLVPKMSRVSILFIRIDKSLDLSIPLFNRCFQFIVLPLEGYKSGNMSSSLCPTS